MGIFTRKARPAGREVPPMAYLPFALEKPLEIRQVYTVHYFEYSSSYAFAGETHDFWEFLYVDKGSLRVTAGA